MISLVRHTYIQLSSKRRWLVKARAKTEESKGPHLLRWQIGIYKILFQIFSKECRQFIKWNNIHFVV